jgi:hypothetical protein
MNKQQLFINNQAKFKLILFFLVLNLKIITFIQSLMI